MASNADEILENSTSTDEDFDTRYHRLADGDLFTDCEFIVGADKTVIKGHKALFSVASEVFQAMFFGHLKETNPVHVEDLEPDGFKGMKTYIYTGAIHFKSVFHALPTYIAARKYLVLKLTRECTTYVGKELKPPQVLEFLDCCRQNSITVFDDLCRKLIEGHTGEAVKSEYFPSAHIDTIELILKSPSLKLESEIEVFGHFERWALAQAEQREIPAEDIATSFDSLKKHVRFLAISGDDFVAKVEPSPLLTREEKYAIAVNKIKFNPELTCENISMLQTSRRFGMSQSDGYEQKHVFNIPIDHTSGNRIYGVNILSRENPNYSNNPNYSAYNDIVSIYWSNFNQKIYFEACTFTYNGRKLMVIKSKFRVIDVHECDDLFFTKQAEWIINNVGRSTQDQQNLLLAVIPISSLKTGHYSRSNDKNVISIEGSFTVELIYF